MNNHWYPRYPGDYGRDTRHLTVTEHGVYCLFLDQYYSTQEPLPKDFNSLYRIIFAQNSLEKSAVRRVAKMFFPVKSDGLRHNRRADAELAKRKARHEKLAVAGRAGGLLSAASKAQARLDGRLEQPLQPGSSKTTTINISTGKRLPGGSQHREKKPWPYSDYANLTDDDLPTIHDYDDIRACADPVIAAIAVTGERDKRAWGFWVKWLNREAARSSVVDARDRFILRLCDLWGEKKAGEWDNPAAGLNKKLQEVSHA